MSLFGSNMILVCACAQIKPLAAAIDDAAIHDKAEAVFQAADRKVLRRFS
jgi:hypothetical protein